MPSRIRMLPKKRSSEGRGVGYRLAWKGDELLMQATHGAGVVMAAQLFAAEQNAKADLYPGHEYDTGTMQRRTHVAQPKYNWDADHVEPTSTTEELGGKIVLPDFVRGKKLALELGCGQKYTIFYHQMYYPFLRIHFEKAMVDFKSKVEDVWRLIVK